MSYDDIQDQIDQGRQQAADVLGPPHDVYRMANPDVNGNVLIAGNRIATGINIFSKIAYGAALRTSFESSRQQGVEWYEIIADMSPFRLGDIFLLTDAVYGAGYSSVGFTEHGEFKGFALADHSPIKKSLGGRLNTTVQIYRPSRTRNDNKQFDRTLDTGEPLVLENGSFSLGDTGDTATKIPAGLMAQGRSYGDKIFDSPTGEKRRSGWGLYMPALKGFQGEEGDRVVAADGSKYVVIIPYTQYVGATGTQWFLEREAA